MDKKVVIISSSMRKDGNSETIAKKFMQGAEMAGNEVEMYCLRDYKYDFCKGCLTCTQTKKCVMHDGATELLENVRTADVLVFATPIYYYAISGQLKTFLDRMNPIYTIGHNFKEVYLLVSCADSNESAIEGPTKDIKGWVSCFDGVELKEKICGTNCNVYGDVLRQKTILEKAYNMGKNV